MLFIDTISNIIPDFESWGALLGLLSPYEYFVTVNNFNIWQRHVAWAKPEGEELRNYVTQRFASNMIVLSLMLSAEVGVFFNSASEAAMMRKVLLEDEFDDVRYWIGVLIALDAVVTIMALLTTFQAWSMVSAISESNTHALLRSSIGQYVISLPPRLVVAALYLFILWLTLFLTNLLNGSARVIVVLVVIVLFFQVIVPLSAFGRLVLHTGAMANRRVLDAEFEKELLPSGLNASLLIRATERQRKCSTTLDHYRRTKTIQQMHTVQNCTRKYYESTGSSLAPTTDSTEQPTVFSDESAQSSRSHLPPQSSFGLSRKSIDSNGTANSGDQLYPRASFLNSATRKELMEFVDELNSSKRDMMEKPSTISVPLGAAAMLVPEPEDDSDVSSVEVQGGHTEKEAKASNRPTSSSRRPKRKKVPKSPAIPTFVERQMQRRSFAGSPSNRQKPGHGHRRHVSDLPTQTVPHFRRAKQFQREWDIEHDVRDLYRAGPPAELLPPQEDVGQLWQQKHWSSWKRMASKIGLRCKPNDSTPLLGTLQESMHQYGDPNEPKNASGLKQDENV